MPPCRALSAAVWLLDGPSDMSTSMVATPAQQQPCAGSHVLLHVPLGQVGLFKYSRGGLVTKSRTCRLDSPNPGLVMPAGTQ